MKVLTQNEIETYLKNLENWYLDKDAIRRDWILKDFSEAMDLINMVAVIAEEHNHHPEIQNVYNKVSLRFNTHDAGGITEKDIKIAQDIDKL
jgi:4a-hydroxytetrahydrobiopterin dehydratase